MHVLDINLNLPIAMHEVAIAMPTRVELGRVWVKCKCASDPVYKISGSELDSALCGY